MFYEYGNYLHCVSKYWLLLTLRDTLNATLNIFCKVAEVNFFGVVINERMTMMLMVKKKVTKKL